MVNLLKLEKEKLLQIQNLDIKMTIKLTEYQVQNILDKLSSQQVIDFLADDVEKSVDWICDFIRSYVDSETLQNKIKKSFPPVQMKLFSE